MTEITTFFFSPVSENRMSTFIQLNVSLKKKSFLLHCLFKMSYIKQIVWCDIKSICLQSYLCSFGTNYLLRPLHKQTQNCSGLKLLTKLRFHYSLVTFEKLMLWQQAISFFTLVKNYILWRLAASCWPWWIDDNVTSKTIPYIQIHLIYR